MSARTNPFGAMSTGDFRPQRNRAFPGRGINPKGDIIVGLASMNGDLDYIHNFRKLPMIVRDLEVLYAYGYWANGRLIQVISQITPDEFALPVAGSYGSIRDALVHVLSAEWGWLERCGGHARGPRLNGVTA